MCVCRASFNYFLKMCFGRFYRIYTYKYTALKVTNKLFNTTLGCSHCIIYLIVMHNTLQIILLLSMVKGKYCIIKSLHTRLFNGKVNYCNILSADIYFDKESLLYPKNSINFDHIPTYFRV